MRILITDCSAVYQGFAVDMDTRELKGFIDHYMTRDEIPEAFGVVGE